jgi:tetratricopeptide (TPR) repeat protein
MPGAFAYHLQSYSASTIRSTTENWCGPLLAKGATCTMGCVYEPYLAGTPNVAVFLQAFGSGYTFGEAAWAAQSVISWQTTVIGDPLYRPFGRTPQQLHAELLRTHSPLDEWAYLRLVNIGLARGARLTELSQILENLDAATNSAVLTEKLADLYESQGKPFSAVDTYQRALKLNPSPEQRVRLRLTLGEKLQAQNSTADAESDYRKLLEESPDYPGKAMIEEKIRALEPKPAGTNAPAK